MEEIREITIRQPLLNVFAKSKLGTIRNIFWNVEVNPLIRKQNSKNFDKYDQESNFWPKKYKKNVVW